MKALILIIINIFTSTFLHAQQVDFSLARTNIKISGVYIFVACEPIQSYDYVGTIKTKLRWNNTTYLLMQKTIEKAKMNNPYFNGIIIDDSDYKKAELIRFKELEVSQGGVKVGSKVSFIKKEKVYYGEVVELESSRGKGTIKYKDQNGKETIIKLKYVDLTPILDKNNFDKSESN